MDIRCLRATYRHKILFSFSRRNVYGYKVALGLLIGVSPPTISTCGILIAIRSHKLLRSTHKKCFRVS